MDGEGQLWQLQLLPQSLGKLSCPRVISSVQQGSTQDRRRASAVVL